VPDSALESLLGQSTRTEYIVQAADVIRIGQNAIKG
jgi:hypothetical protein